MECSHVAQVRIPSNLVVNALWNLDFVTLSNFLTSWKTISLSRRATFYEVRFNCGLRHLHKSWYTFRSSGGFPSVV